MYVLGRAIDYHDRNPWAIVWCALSPQDELFVYREWTVDLNKWVNKTIAEEVARKSGYEKYALNLIDPLANKVQTNTGRTVVEDLNEYFFKLRRKGVGTGGFWEPFDTKGTVGRDSIRTRLRNSIAVGRPFRNETTKDGRRVFLPTMWVFRSCGEIARSIKQWRYDEWSARVMTTKDRNENTAQKFSHYPTAIEGLLKDRRFRARTNLATPRKNRPTYFEVRE